MFSTTHEHTAPWLPGVWLGAGLAEPGPRAPWRQVTSSDLNAASRGGSVSQWDILHD